MAFEFSRAYAQQLDTNDSLKSFRNEFFIPKVNGKTSVYLTGNSLGCQPKAAATALQNELNDWAKYGVEGHFHAQLPWVKYHEFFAEPLAELVGAKTTEVVAMNGLTTNVHLLLVSFYRPTAKRYKILCEAKAFPSDQYALESQVKFHGFQPNDALLEIEPRESEHTLNEEDILNAIEQHHDELALVFFGGVNYYTGQVFDMQKIAAKAKQYGITVGFDLAHGVGNIPMQLHNWQVDFAAWCSYKYLNSGPGSVSGIFVHEQHHTNTELPRFAGWWGHNKTERFKMEKGFQPIPTAEAWQLSNAPVLAMAVHLESLKIFQRAGIHNLRAKSEQLTSYLEYCIQQVSEISNKVNFEVITPKNVNQRGCQLSILTHGSGKVLFDVLTKNGVIADWREPNVIRIAPVPLYNSFEDAYDFAAILNTAVENL